MRSGAAAQRRLRATSFLSSFDRFTIPPLLVPIHRALGVSLGTASLVASAYFVAYGLSQPLWGALSDRVGRVPVIRGAVVGGALACVVAAAARDIGVLILARTVAGLFFAALVPTAITYIGDTVDLRHRQHALTIMMAFATAGIASATVVGGVAAQVLSWRWAFLVSAVIAALLTAFLRGLPEPVRERSTRSFGQQVQAIAHRPWVRVVVGLAFVEGAVIFGSLTFVAASLQQAGVGAALAGSAAAGFGLANVICTPLVTRAIPRVPAPRLIAGGSSLAALGLFVAAADTTVATAVVASVGLGAGFGFLHSTMQTWATQVYPQARAVTVSFFASAIFIGGAVASAAAAPLANAGRFSLIFLVAAVGAAGLALGGSLLRARYAAGSEQAAAADESAAVAL
ncbi:MAG TPA: MFS transporter [Solirubrobacteraceae bacterium]